MASEESSPSLTKCQDQYGLDLKEAYKLSLRFYKENEGKSVQLQYNDKLKLVALIQQATHGQLAAENLSPLGALDVIGKDRRSAWESLGDMPQDEAMFNFIEGIAKSMPHWNAYVETVKKEMEEGKIKQQEAMEKAASEAKLAKESEMERQRQEEQRRQIQDALNRQSYEEFRSYAQQQYPDNPDQQGVLIRQLQEQHYYQYMQQVYQQQQMINNQCNDNTTLTSSTATTPTTAEAPSNTLTADFASMAITDEDADETVLENGEENEDYQEEHECTDECGFCADDEVSPASMWTKKELAEFKDSIRNEGGDSIIKVSHGETVTVRVPTHKDGSALFWEFATDHYDIAFGLFFEWTETDETEVSVHISDSEDEDVDDDYNDEDDNGDLENGGAGSSATSRALLDKGPPTSVIVPIFRRDCHQEVYAGTHNYPGRGVYLLKFDNTYSLWRSKTLYYRVYYTR